MILCEMVLKMCSGQDFSFMFSNTLKVGHSDLIIVPDTPPSQRCSNSYKQNFIILLRIENIVWINRET